MAQDKTSKAAPQGAKVAAAGFALAFFAIIAAVVIYGLAAG